MNSPSCRDKKILTEPVQIRDMENEKTSSFPNPGRDSWKRDEKMNCCRCASNQVRFNRRDFSGTNLRLSLITISF